MMKLKWIGSLLILAGIVGCKTPDRPNLVEYVNPNIGTVHSRWFFYTPAAEPFGLAKLGASRTAPLSPWRLPILNNIWAFSDSGNV